MRAFDGQHSDNVAIKRTREQKQLQLQQLKEQLATLKTHAAPAIRESLVKRIAELDAELRQPAKPPREARGDGKRPDGSRSDGSRGDGNRSDGPRHPRREPRREQGSDAFRGGSAPGEGFASPRRRS